MAATFVGVIQIPRCKYYLSDVGVGAAIGLAAGAITARSQGSGADRDPGREAGDVGDQTEQLKPANISGKLETPAPAGCGNCPR
jgi:hypothetical protein